LNHTDDFLLLDMHHDDDHDREGATRWYKEVSPEAERNA
jgi:hypothetical protein